MSKAPRGRGNLFELKKTTTQKQKNQTNKNTLTRQEVIDSTGKNKRDKRTEMLS